jgi:hypothetical protein
MEMKVMEDRIARRREARGAARLAIALAAAAAAGLAAGEEAPRKFGYTDTPVLPGQRWRVHDLERPQPAEVTPAPPEAPARPPSDAVVLFDGTDLSKWAGAKGGKAGWKVENGYAEVNGTGDIRTVDAFGDCQLHIEWATPDPPQGDPYNRGNSGVFFFGKYELQIFESYKAGIYADGQAAAIYGQHPPRVNASRKPGAWQAFDVLFTAPRFKDGKLDAPAYMTVLHNGVLVHHHAAVLGATAHRSLPKYAPHDPKGPIVLQDHKSPVRYRNIWVRPVKGYDEQ